MSGERYATREAYGLDAIRILENLREEEKREIRKMGADVTSAVLGSFACSDCVYVLSEGDKAILMFGVYEPLIGVPLVWALGTTDCDKCPLLMVKWGRMVTDILRKNYGKLENWCDADYTASLRWLRLIGFTVDDPVDGFCHLHTEVEQCAS